MQPQQPGQPLPPAGPHNNYDFIMNPGTPPKKSPLGGNSMATRILVVVGGLFLLVVIVAVFLSLISSAGKSFDNAAMTGVVQTQVELQRLSETGKENSISQANKNFSGTASLGLASDQATLSAHLTERGLTINPKVLPLKQNAEVTSQLEDAQSASNFDPVYKTAMQRALQVYQNDLKQAYDSSDNETKQLLDSLYKNATLLLTQLNAGNEVVT